MAMFCVPDHVAATLVGNYYDMKTGFNIAQ